jgi:Uma2 family endonuclease
MHRMSTLPVRRLTEVDYLAQERKAETKSEFYNGDIFAMAGARRNHNLIAGNIYGELREQLRKGPCEAYLADMRVKVAKTGLYAYPDIAIACGEPRFLDNEDDTLLNPTLIVEVLSESTARYVRNLKSRLYRKLPSLRQYLIVEQDEPLIEVYSRSPDGEWKLKDASELAQSVTLKSIGCKLSLAAVYEKVKFPVNPEGPRPGPR